MHAGAVLDCCFHDDSSRFSTGADHTVRSVSLCNADLSLEALLGHGCLPRIELPPTTPKIILLASN
ncbi:hypothetical protein E2562_003012 [Oryza meyeriana var. granulata]|uniref:Uncharacterized protein n=1 Tax=Oryza meyeriana var. granulata TaxID=110450 RepID=A0A6G1DDR1_9ORYZ|nr:hypothetical protein E2562_003012 [Oryza meyeriana var. granulata]